FGLRTESFIYTFMVFPLFLRFFPFLGWSNHFVSKRDYHFLIPMDDLWNKPLGESVLNAHQHMSPVSCTDSSTLMAMATCFVLIGLKVVQNIVREIMDLWDWICTILKARYKTDSH
ncbi:hypothetical protein TorRG33x02_091600, partial [Trema orientale]